MTEFLGCQKKMILKTHKAKSELAEKILNSKGPVLVECLFDTGTRSAAQNSAMHLYFTQLAQELNDAGLDVRSTLREDIDHEWNKDLVKELIWRPIQVAMKGKDSTTKLFKMEVSDIYETINRHMAEKFGISVPWPSVETMQES